MSFEQIMVVGNIGSAEILVAKSQNRYLKVTVACNRGSGEKKKTTWYSVLMFGRMVENIDTLITYFRPGRLVIATGRPQAEAYMKNDGTVGLENSIIANSLPQLLDYKKAEN
jgi:single-stranded DNA-binding protein